MGMHGFFPANCGLLDPALWNAMKTSVDVIFEDARWEAFGLEALVQRAALAVFAELSVPGDAEICVMGCDDARIASLNADFRGKPAATNVLSWPSAERGSKVEGEAPRLNLGPGDGLGDIALAYETCAVEAAEAGKPMTDHVSHLVVHGVLHLLGYDHIREGDALLMEATEVRILASLGISDPY